MEFEALEHSSTQALLEVLNFSSELGRDFRGGPG
jgi:hypothetical protein